MKKNSAMTLILLALFGCALTLGSIYKLYKNKVDVAENPIPKLNEQQEDITTQKISLLENELKETKQRFEVAEEKISTLTTQTVSITNQNIPIIEIKDIDLEENEDVKNRQKDINNRLIYNHQIKFSIVNVGNHSLKDVIFSIKDIYNDPIDTKAKKKLNQINYLGKKMENEDVGSYNNIEINTLNLKSKKQLYVSNLPVSFGTGDYYFDMIVEWKGGFYQMHVDIEEINGKLKYRYKFYDINGIEFNL